MRQGDRLVVNFDDPWVGTVISSAPTGKLWTVMRDHDGASFPIEEGGGGYLRFGNALDEAQESKTR